MNEDIQTVSKQSGQNTPLAIAGIILLIYSIAGFLGFFIWLPTSISSFVDNRQDSELISFVFYQLSSVTFFIAQITVGVLAVRPSRSKKKMLILIVLCGTLSIWAFGVFLLRLYDYQSAALNLGISFIQFIMTSPSILVNHTISIVLPMLILILSSTRLFKLSLVEEN